LDITNLTIGNGSLDKHAAYTVVGGIIMDEDIQHNISTHLSGFTAKIFYLTGTTIHWEIGTLMDLLKLY